MGMVQVVGEWLREVAVASRRYRDELLSAVLDLLLSAPPSLIRPTVHHTAHIARQRYTHFQFF